MKKTILLFFSLGWILCFLGCGGDDTEMEPACEDVPVWTLTINNSGASAIVEDGFLKIRIPEPQAPNDVVLSTRQQEFHPVDPNRDTRDFALSTQVAVQNLDATAGAEQIWMGMNLKYTTVPDSSILSIIRTTNGSTIEFDGHFNNRGSDGSSGIFDIDVLIFDSDMTYNVQNVAQPTGLTFPKITLPDPFLVEFEFGVRPSPGSEQENLEFWIYQINFSDFRDIVQVAEMPDDDFNCNSIN